MPGTAARVLESLTPQERGVEAVSSRFFERPAVDQDPLTPLEASNPGQRRGGEWILGLEEVGQLAQFHLSDDPRRRRGGPASDIERILDELGGLGHVLSTAAPKAKAQVYASLGLKLRYQPNENRVVATADLGRRDALPA